MNAFFSRCARVGLLALCFLLLLLSPYDVLRAAAGQPVTVKELCLMLRGGYTGDEVLHETAGRPLLEPIDADAEKLLHAAGADARLIAALKSTHPALTDDQAAAARAKQAAIDERNLASQIADRANLLAFHKQAAEAHQSSLKEQELGKLAGQLRGQLVTYKSGSFQPYDESTLVNKKLFALYFANQSNAQCRQFTPQLVQFYRDFAPKHLNFEVVFFSMDPTASEMEDNMRQNAMPWPALAFDREAVQTSLMDMGKQGVPRLMLIDGASRLVSDSFAGGKYVGPQHVLDDLKNLADAASAGTTANAAPGAAPAASTPAPTPSPHLMDDLLRGKLVKFQNGAFVPFDNDPLERKKVIGLYYSNFVSGGGRKFTPELVKLYQRLAPAHPEFEVVTVSEDRSVYNMGNMVSQNAMPWPSVAFDQITKTPGLTTFMDHDGASRLVVFNNLGQYVADYAITYTTDNVADIIGDLEKVIADPSHPSAMAPPHPGTPGMPQ